MSDTKACSTVDQAEAPSRSPPPRRDQVAAETDKDDAPPRRTSPPRRPTNKNSSSGAGGFKWKKKDSQPLDSERIKHDDRDGAYDGQRSGRVGGYRDRSPPRRQQGKPYDDRDGRDGRDDRERRDERRDDRRSPERRTNWGDRDRDRDRDRDVGRRQDDRPPRRDYADSARRSDVPRRPPPPPTMAAGGGEEMMIVNINDRLGTKAAIPCLASDTVGQFKIIVAMRIGRKPHEILIKRQGERPMKDHITLGDYGVSNGVQLDLEVDTGD